MRGRWWAIFEPLWIIGLMVLCLVSGFIIFRGPWLNLQGKTYDWAQYAVAGVVFPSLLFGLPLLWRWRQWPTTIVAPVKRSLVVGCLVAFAVLIVASIGKYGLLSAILPVALAGLQMLVMTRPWHRDRINAPRLLGVFVFALVSWTIALSLFLQAYVQSPVFLVGFALAFLLVSEAVREPAPRTPFAWPRPGSPANVLALLFLALMSLRTEHLFEVAGEQGAIHHMGAWVGAADLVREGGWLLWDTPSNYGFLNVLAFTFVPTATPWQSFYLLQAFTFFIVSGSIFLLFRAMRLGWFNWCFSLAMAVAIPMFTRTFNPAGPVTATFNFPNWGTYRYFWAFILLLILVWERITDEDSTRYPRVLVTGCLAWVIGVLWSPESAFFSSGVWLPAYAVMVLQRSAGRPHRWRRAVGWLLLPAAMLAAAVGLIAIIFLLGVGHLPDWGSFFDYAVAIGPDVLVVVHEPIGPALGMLLGFCLLAMGAFYTGLSTGLPTRSFRLWVGLLGAFLAVNSFGYQRGVDFLHPIAFATLGVLLLLATNRRPARDWVIFARTGTVPLLVLILVSPLAAVAANPLAIREAAASLVETARHRFEIEYLIPDADPELQALMAEAGIQAETPIFYAADWLGNLLLPWRPGGATDGPRVLAGRHWTPGHPVLALRWIPPGRGAVYTGRYIARRPMSGWLIQSKTGQGASLDFNAYASGLEPWFYDVVARTHVPTRVHESEHWQLVWFEYVGAAADVARPTYAWGQLSPLPHDVSVNGEPLRGTAQPDVWAMYGTGWNTFNPERDGRRMQPEADLWIYSPTERTIELHLTPGEIPGRRNVRLIVNDDPAHAQRLVPGQAVAFPLDLQAGWNRTILSTERGQPRASRADQQEPSTPAATTTANESAGPANDVILVSQIDLVLTPN